MRVTEEEGSHFCRRFCLLLFSLKLDFMVSGGEMQERSTEGKNIRDMRQLVCASQFCRGLTCCMLNPVSEAECQDHSTLGGGRGENSC